MDDELGVAGFGTEPDGAAVLLNDALNDAESDAGADADGLGGVEGVEDLGLAFERDSGAVVGDADAEIGVGFAGVGFLLGPGANADLAMLGYGVDGVVEEVGPDLIEAGALAVQNGKVGSEGLSRW